MRSEEENLFSLSYEVVKHLKINNSPVFAPLFLKVDIV